MKDKYRPKAEAFARLLEIMDTLREQCPWDRKQTFQTLRNLTIEETYELVDALLEEDLDGIEEELGDLMLHLVFYARIGEEKKAFDVASLIHRECDKLIARHPHIYGDWDVDDAEQVKKNWEQLKLKEGKRSVLQGVPKALPALVKAQRMQEKAAQVGFDWPNATEVWEKVREEMEEFRLAVEGGSSMDKQEEEFGDLLFSLVNYARFLGLDPETALARTNMKFKKRFEYIEGHASEGGLQNMSLEEMDALWNKAKGLERDSA